jgi:hypothetical protein
MQTVMEGYRGIRVLFNLNWDLMFTLGTVLAALVAGAFLGQVLAGA